MWNVMTACVIMHNMIVENERNDSIYDQGWDFQGELAEPAAGWRLGSSSCMPQIVCMIATFMIGFN
jgi:hypothetical protein